MPQFDTSTYVSQIFWLVICLSFLGLVVSKIYLPKILTIMNKRDQNILEYQNLAKHYQNEFELLQESRNKKLSDAKIHAHKTVSEALAKMELKQAEHIEKFEKEMALQLSDFKESLRFRKTKIESKLDQNASELAEQILQKLFHVSLGIHKSDKEKLDD